MFWITVLIQSPIRMEFKSDIEEAILFQVARGSPDFQTSIRHTWLHHWMALFSTWLSYFSQEIEYHPV